MDKWLKCRHLPIFFLGFLTHFSEYEKITATLKIIGVPDHGIHIRIVEYKVSHSKNPFKNISLTIQDMSDNCQHLFYITSTRAFSFPFLDTLPQPLYVKRPKPLTLTMSPALS